MKRPMQYLPLTLDGKCDVCGKHRSHGNHQKCSAKRKAAQMELQRIAELEQTCTLNRINYSALSPVERLALVEKRV